MIQGPVGHGQEQQRDSLTPGGSMSRMGSCSGIIAGVLLWAASSLAAPIIDGVVAVRSATEPGFAAVTVSGSGLGTPGGNTFLYVIPSTTIDSMCDCATLPALPDCSSVQCVVSWSDDLIVAKAPAGSTLRRAIAYVASGGPQSLHNEPAAVDNYRLEVFDAAEQEQHGPKLLRINQAPGTAPSARRLYTVHEHHKDFKQFNPAMSRIATMPLGHPTLPIFWTYTADPMGLGGSPSNVADIADGVTVDPYGRFWFSDTGNGTVPAVPAAHSHVRIVMYDPSTRKTCVYNVPGNDNYTFGIAFQQNYEPGKDRVWITEALRRAPGADVIRPHLTWFDPSQTPCNDGTYDFRANPDTCEGTSCLDASGRACEADTDCETASCANGSCTDGGPCSSDDDCQRICIAGACPSGAACGNDDDCRTCCLPPDCPGEAGTCSDGSGRPCSDEFCNPTWEFCAPSCSQNAANADAGCRPGCGGGYCNSRPNVTCLVDTDCSLGAAKACMGGSCQGSTMPCTTDADCLVQSCRWDAGAVAGCKYHYYEVPPVPGGGFYVNGLLNSPLVISQLALDESGGVWFTDFILGNYLGRLNPANGVIDMFPAPVLEGGVCGSNQLWEILLAPPRPLQSVGDIIFTTLPSSWPPTPPGKFYRFDATRRTDPACKTLVGGANPCITEVAKDALQMAFDRHANMYFTGGPYMLGYAKHHTNHLVHFPPTAMFPREIAERKHATQGPASWFPAYGAYRAVDGNTSGLFANNSTTLTGAQQPHAWWEVDLGRVRAVDQIRVWPCTDCSSSLRDFWVMSSDSDVPSDDLNYWLTNPAGADWKSYYSGAATAPVTFTPPAGTQARYVRVQRTDTNVPLELAEVQVMSPPPQYDFTWGLAIDPVTSDIWLGHTQRGEIWRLAIEEENLALGRNAFAFNYFPNVGPYRAVDGNTGGSSALHEVALAAASQQPFWQVDLGGSYRLDEIAVWACTDCTAVLRDFYVLASDQDFNTLAPDQNLATLLAYDTQTVWRQFVSGNAGRPSSVYLSRNARYVRVQVDWPGTTVQQLWLPEVEVLGGKPAECSSAASCNDGIPCTEDLCRNGRCEHTCMVGESRVTGTPVCATGQTCQSFAGGCCCSAEQWPFAKNAAGYFTGAPCPN